MRFLIRSLFALVLSSLPAQARVTFPSQSEEDSVVARVGDVELTRADLRSEYKRLIPANYFHNQVPDGKRMELLRKAMDSLVEKTLIDSDARRRGIEATEEELRAELDRAIEKAGSAIGKLTDEQYESLFQESRAALQRKVLRDKNEARFEASVPPVTEDELRARYEEQKGRLLTAEVARFGHILLRVAPDASNAEAKAIHERAQVAVERIRSGEDFAAVAREVSEDIFASEGGDMGFVSRDDFLQKPIGEAAFELADGQVSDVLSSIYGFHIVKRIESKERRPLTFEEAEPILRDALAREHRKSARAAWMAELREIFPVEVLVDLSDPPAAGNADHSPDQ